MTERAAELADTVAQWGDDLRLERLRRRLRQADIAARAGISQASVSETENGRGSPETCAAIASALGVDLEDPS